MRILLAVQRFWPAVGGAERFFFEMATRLAGEGHGVAVYTTDARDLGSFDTPGAARIPPEAPAACGGATVRRFRTLRFPRHRSLFTFVSSLPARGVGWLAPPPALVAPGLFRALLRPARFDAVMAGVFPFTAIPYFALKGARRAGVPFVLAPLVHTGEPGDPVVVRDFANGFQMDLMRLSDRVIALTESEKGYLVRHGLDAARVAVAGAGIEPGAMEGGSGRRFREKHGIRGAMVLHVANRMYDKGTQHTIEAMKLLWDRGIEATLVLGGPARPDAQAHLDAQPERVRARCLSLGRFTDGEKRDLFRACDVFAMPSRTDSFGIVYLEAWLCGKPVVGAFAGGVPDVIVDGENGFLVPFGDVHMLAHYLGRLLAEKNLAASMGEAGRRRVLERYTWEIQYGKVRDLLRSVAGPREGRAGA
ncbi:MAG: glycosyltransferase family 4 protein [Candidatus Aureabacteria bacterium]|nr:glycosyltransferase family 4 protein [Candidatus Auribacterota bacterium]